MLILIGIPFSFHVHVALVNFNTVHGSLLKPGTGRDGTATGHPVPSRLLKRGTRRYARAVYEPLAWMSDCCTQLQAPSLLLVSLFKGLSCNN